MRELLDETEQMAATIGQGSPAPAPLNLDVLRNPGSTIVANAPSTSSSDLDVLRERSGAEELTLLTREGRVLGSSTSVSGFVPHLPQNALLLQLRQGRSYIGLDPIRDAGLYVRVAVNVPEATLQSGRRILYALYPIADASEPARGFRRVRVRGIQRARVPPGQAEAQLRDDTDARAAVQHRACGMGRAVFGAGASSIRSAISPPVRRPSRRAITRRACLRTVTTTWDFSCARSTT